MLRKKEYTAILELAKSKDEIVKLFSQIYSPAPAIRIVKLEYQRGTEKRAYHILCDKCGNSYDIEASKDAEYDKEICTCPECGFSICYKGNSYYHSKEQFALNEAHQGYNHIYTKDEEILQPTFVVFETVLYDKQRYYLIRRFHFSILQGSISKTRIYRCLIIPEREDVNYAALYEKEDGELAISFTENPKDWFYISKYQIPYITKYFVDENANAFLTRIDRCSDALDEWCIKLHKSMHYHSHKCVEARKFLADYPVNDAPRNVEPYKCYLEDHGKYLVFRKFCLDEEEIHEVKRWVFSYITGYNETFTYKNGEWEKESYTCYDSFNDHDILSVKEELLKTDVGKMGLREYLDYTQANLNCLRYGIDYLTSLYDKPVIETLAKTGLSYLIPDVISDRIKIYKSEKRLWQKLGLSKANFEFAKKEILSPGDFNKLCLINQYDTEVDSNAFFRWISDFDKVDMYSIDVIVKHLGVNLKQIIDYLESVYYEQGCDCQEAVVQWRDYLRNYYTFYDRNPQTEDERFPESLKKAHDILSMRNTKWAYEYNGFGKKFSNLMKKWKHLEFENEKFRIVLPETPRDISLEGAKQHHCVSGYIKSVLNGECVILFLRKKECEDRPFLTLEYDTKKSIRQMKGKRNQDFWSLLNVDVARKLIQFLADWSQKTGIDTGVEIDKEVV